MPKAKKSKDVLELPALPTNLWNLRIKELAGRNLETAGREEVNKMLEEGWLLLHVYTLKYQEDSVWRERPMAILGRPASKRK